MSVLCERNRSSFLKEINEGIRLENKIFSLLICSAIFLSIYGAIIGSSHSWLQGSKFSFTQYIALLLASLSMIGVMLFGFAPMALIV